MAPAWATDVEAAIDELATENLDAAGYEEGTWMPTLSWSTAGTSSFSYTVQEGSYVRVGSLVTLSFLLIFAQTIGTGAGTLRIGGIPFTMHATNSRANGFVTSVSVNWTWPNDRTTLTLYGASASLISVGAIGSAQPFGSVNTANVISGATHTVQGMFFYQRA